MITRVIFWPPYVSVHKCLHTHTNANTHAHTYDYSPRITVDWVPKLSTTYACARVLVQASHQTLRLCKCPFTFMQACTGVLVHTAPLPINHPPWCIFALVIETFLYSASPLSALALACHSLADNLQAEFISITLLTS